MDDATMNLQFSRHVPRDDRDLVNLVEYPFCRTFPIHVVIYIFRCTGKSDTGTIRLKPRKYSAHSMPLKTDAVHCSLVKNFH